MFPLDIGSLKVILASVWNYDGVKLITCGVVLNVLLAVAVALRTGQFSFRVLGEFLGKQLGPYVILYYGFKLFSEGTGFDWVSVAVLALITTMIAASIIEKLKLLGVPIPDQIMQLVTAPIRLPAPKGEAAEGAQK